MQPKRPRGAGTGDSHDVTITSDIPPRKRQRIYGRSAAASDRISSLSDELLLRVLSFLGQPETLLAVAPVSNRFHSLCHDSQLWKPLYYARFVLPRAMRIPGFRDGFAAQQRSDQGTAPGQGWKESRLHYSGRKRLWVDGRREGLVRASGGEDSTGNKQDDRIDWLKQYKLRHNWSRGKCAVEELKLGKTGDDYAALSTVPPALVKVVDGLAITMDARTGLRAWDPKTRVLIAGIDLADGGELLRHPTCMAVDEQDHLAGLLNVAIGYDDGSFGVWRLDTTARTFELLYEPVADTAEEGIIDIAYLHPYVLTARDSVLISLYAFGDKVPDLDELTSPVSGKKRKKTALQRPALLTSLHSHSSDAPLVLSIRKMATSTIASIAYTFWTRQGWSLGIQDLQILEEKSSVSKKPTIATRLAYTDCVPNHHFAFTSQAMPPMTPRRRRHHHQTSPSSSPPINSPSRPDRSLAIPTEKGPTSLCYNHPYLLATLPDNTLILYLCTSTTTSLTISPGIRLFGHTAGIGDAEITSRGKAVSVSSQGDEMRVWELEGRPAGIGKEKGACKSVEIRADKVAEEEGTKQLTLSPKWEERRSWVGFDDEMVIVLKQSRLGAESLMVYDFT